MAVAAFFAADTTRPKRQPAEVARRLRDKPRRLAVKMRRSERGGRSADDAGIDDRL